MRWTACYVVTLILCVSASCHAMGLLPRTEFTNQVLAKAEIDECYNGIGEPFMPGPVCSDDEKPKANQTYLWGLAKSGDDIWIATGSNILCLMNAGTAYTGGLDLNPLESNLWVCEYGQGQYLTQMGLEAPSNIFSDFRPPKIYTYNLATQTLRDKTLEITDPEVQAVLDTTYGFRSAIAFNNLVFIAGPLGNYEGVNLFVYDAVNGDLVGAQSMTEYNSIRRWAVLNDVLYTTVTTPDGGGRVLRWTGSAADPFSFEEVGMLDCRGAEIAVHNGRLYVGTWPSAIGTLAGLWMSPAVPSGGLTAADANNWQKVWQVDQYEPDPVVANLYGMGAMVSYNGQLYWGTMHVHGNVVLLAVQQYGIGVLGMPSAFRNVWRSIAIFRGSDFENGGNVELLYGNASLPAYVSTAFGGYWVNRPNNMGGVSGKFGTSGFGNPFNNYTWTMAVYKDQLFVGTMDNSYLWLNWDNFISDWFDGLSIDTSRWLTPESEEYGADLWRFPSDSEAAVRMTRNGFDNYTNYGFRTVVADDSGLYLGTANPANIAQDDSGNPIGGWELIKVTKN